MKIKIGDDLPSAQVFFLDNSNLVQKNIRDLTVGGKTIIFGLPGAFTSVCSVKHLPGFVRSYESVLKKGVAEYFMFISERSICHESLGGKKQCW